VVCQKFKKPAYHPLDLPSSKLGNFQIVTLSRALRQKKQQKQEDIHGYDAM